MKISRREFVGGASAIAIAAMDTSEVHARLFHGTAPPPSGFNGGKSQANFNYLQGGGDYPFINFLKIAQSWNWHDGNGTLAMTPDLFDSDYYPLTNLHGGVSVGGITVPTQVSRPGNYVCTWSGIGSVDVPGTPCVLNITGATAANPCVLTLSSIANGNGNAIFVANQEITIAGVTGTDAALINGTRQITSVSVNGLTVTLNLNMAGKSFSAASATATHVAATTLGAGFGRCVWSTNSIGLTFGITNVGTPHITNCKFYHYDDEARVNAGEVWSPFFKQKIQEANFGVLRLMTLMNLDVGDNFASNWDTANCPTTFYSFQAGQVRLDLMGGTSGGGFKTTSNGSDYTITAPSTWTTSGGKPAGGSMVHVVFDATSPTTSDAQGSPATNTGNLVNWTAHGLKAGNQVFFTNGTSGTGNTQPLIVPFDTPITGVYFVIAAGLTANQFAVSTTNGGSAATLSSLSAVCRALPTLNVGSTAPLYIFDEAAGPLSLGGGAYPVGGATGSLATMVYSAVMNVWVTKGGNSLTVAGNATAGNRNGVPTSLVLQLCREVGAHPWFNGPRFAVLEGNNDYYTQLATLCKTQPAWMIPRFEGPNESFANDNGAYMGRCSSYLSAKYSTSWANKDVYGKFISLMGQTVASVYGVIQANVTSQTFYHLISGQQTTTFTSTTDAAGSNSNLSAARYVADEGGDAAWKWCTHVCGANYFAPTIYGRNQELVYAFAWYVTNNGNAAAQLVNASDYENFDVDTTFTVASITAGSPGIITTTVNHNLFLGQILTFLFPNSPSNNAGLFTANYWVNTIPAANQFTLSSTDPNNTVLGQGGGSNPLTLAGSPTGTIIVLPNNGFSIPAVNIYFTNMATWAHTFNAALKVECYEGGYSPDYSGADVLAYITDGTATTNSVFTIPSLALQDIHSPIWQSNAANSGLVAGMRLKISGMSGLPNGWAIADNTVITITSVSGASITTNFNASGATGTLANALSTKTVNPSGSSYNNSTGVVTLNAAISPGTAAPGDTIFVSLTTSLQNTTQNLNQQSWTAGAGTNATTIVFTAPAGFGVTTITGGTVGDSTIGPIYGLAIVQDVNGNPAHWWLNNLRNAGKNSTHLQANLTTMYNDIAALGEFPSMFQMTGNLTASEGMFSTSVWSVLEDIYQSPNPPQWLAAIAYNH